MASTVVTITTNSSFSRLWILNMRASPSSARLDDHCYPVAPLPVLIDC
jgi:hypothetical protein